MNLSLYEQETIINYNEEEATASIYTHNRALIRKLDKFESFPKKRTQNRIKKPNKNAEIG